MAAAAALEVASAPARTPKAQWRASARVAVRLMLEHHPLCREFRADRFQATRAMAFCSGCALAVPGVLVGLVAGCVALLPGRVDAWPLLAAGFALGAPQGLTYLVRFSRPVRAAIKALGGSGMGLVAASWLFLPAPWSWRLVAACALAAVFGVLQAVRIRSILRTCRACPWAMDWDRCPGFRATTPEDVAWGDASPGNAA